MAPTPKKPATYEDLRAVPDTLVAEIVEGELVVSPRPAVPHALAASTLGMDLGGPFEVFRLERGSWLAAQSGNERVRAEPFDAIELELEALWLPEPAPGSPPSL